MKVAAKFSVLFIAALTIFLSCNNEVYNQGEGLYKKHCANCHGNQGEGFRALYPPLKGADFLLKNKNNLACIIKYGLSGEIVVNGKTYNQPMLGINELSTTEVTNILNYMLKEFAHSEEYIMQTEVEQQLRSCRTQMQKN